jgi:DNA invertase Pin-like site-specific DNA recombinase
MEKRGIDDVLKHLGAGDRLIVSELSRLGRSLGQIIHIVDTLVKRNIRFGSLIVSVEIPICCSDGGFA